MLWSGRLPQPPGWAEAAHTQHRLAVVFVAGTALDDPDRDRLAEIRTAISNCAAVGATLELASAA